MGAASRFEFVEGATGDLSFVARGPTVETAFIAASEAFLATTVVEPELVQERERRSIVLEEPDHELLLMRFLNELVFLRDSEELLLHATHLEITRDHSVQLRADLAGEHIDHARHHLASEVKAATAHGLQVAKTSEGCSVTATLDV